MAFSYKIFFCAIALVGAIVYVIFLLPPLTSGGNYLLPGVSEAELRRAMRTERAYCETSTSGIDCACFAGKSGIVRAAEGPRIPGARYADQQRLARDQAASSC